MVHDNAPARAHFRTQAHACDLARTQGRVRAHDFYSQSNFEISM